MKLWFGWIVILDGWRRRWTSIKLGFLLFSLGIHPFCFPREDVAELDGMLWERGVGRRWWRVSGVDSLPGRTPCLVTLTFTPPPLYYTPQGISRLFRRGALRPIPPLYPWFLNTVSCRTMGGCVRLSLAACNCFLCRDWVLSLLSAAKIHPWRRARAKIPVRNSSVNKTDMEYEEIGSTIKLCPSCLMGSTPHGCEINLSGIWQDDGIALNLFTTELLHYDNTHVSQTWIEKWVFYGLSIINTTVFM